MIGTLLALVNTIALLVVLSNKPVDGVHPGADFVLIFNVIVTVYFVIEQVRCISYLYWCMDTQKRRYQSIFLNSLSFISESIFCKVSHLEIFCNNEN